MKWQAVTDSEQGTGRLWDAMKWRERYRVSVDKVLIGITNSSNKDLQFIHDQTLLRNSFIIFRQGIPVVFWSSN
jgi:hypothetical protein